MARWSVSIIGLVLAAGCAGDGPRGCSGFESSERGEVRDLVSLGFEALKTNDVSLVEPLIMTEERYRQVREEVGGSAEGPGDAEIVLLARKAKEALDASFVMIQGLLDQLGFDRTRAQLRDTVVRRECKCPEATQWIRYSEDDPRIRLDIVYVIESEGNLAVIKLNDATRVGDQRYLGRGFYFSAYRPADSGDENVSGLVTRYHLEGWVPVVHDR